MRPHAPYLRMTDPSVRLRRPVEHEWIVYSGRVGYHTLKYQVLLAPDGITYAGKPIFTCFAGAGAGIGLIFVCVQRLVLGPVAFMTLLYYESLVC